MTGGEPVQIASSAAALTVDLPPGFEGRVTTRDTDPADHSVSAASVGLGLVQVATFPLPVGVGDFGGGATPRMGFNDILVVFLEYGRESVGTPLFGRERRPTLSTADFDENQLQHNLGGQSGSQTFFVEGGRAWCLYVVLGSHLNRARAVPVVNQVVGSVRIG